MLKRVLRIAALLAALLSLALVVVAGVFWNLSRQDPIEHLYTDNCAVCHGENLEGSTLAPPLVHACTHTHIPAHHRS